MFLSSLIFGNRYRWLLIVIIQDRPKVPMRSLKSLEAKFDIVPPLIKIIVLDL